MRAMVLERAPGRLVERTRPAPTPGPDDVLLAVGACGVCRTDLHIVDGELTDPVLPLVPGHEIVGRVVAAGARVDQLAVGARVGVPWLASACGTCAFCRRGDENLCGGARFTGYHRDGGYAELATADARFVLPLPEGDDDAEVAPLLCAGLIGYRAYRKAGSARRLGLYGFGAAAHIVAQAAVQEGREVYAFTRPGDGDAQAFAHELGATWAGDSTDLPPARLDAALIFAPVGSLVPQALAALERGGRVVCAGIHMSDIPAFPYELLWGEREIVSVANLTREDGHAFFALLSRVTVRTTVRRYPLAAANDALDDLRAGRLQGAAVVSIGE
jgi:alcohol dehydrogenase, propanol-preferring